MNKKTVATGVKLGAVLALLATTGCAEFQKRTVSEPSGSPFTRALFDEYMMFGETEQNIMYDEVDASRYFYRADKSAQGCTLMPFDPAQWNIADELMPELQAGRAQMLNVFAYGARAIAPEMSAHMQSHYDCWVEQSEEGWQAKDIKACRAEFYNSLADVEALVLGSFQAPSANVVLFTNGNAELNAEAMRVIDDAVMDAMAPEFGRRIHVIGHTDAKGPEGKNQKLSEARAKAVVDELIRRGVPSEIITSEGKGEMPGPQNEADNRRADILYLEYKM